MKPDDRSIRWTPRGVFWLSLFAMGLVVAGVGLNGTRYVVDYLQLQIKEHGIEHNQEIAQRLRSLLKPRLTGQADNDVAVLKDVAMVHGTFGYRLFLVAPDGRLAVDSHGPSGESRHYRDTWLDDLEPLPSGKGFAELSAGPWGATAENSHPMLVWLEPLEATGWLGVASGHRNFADFVGELHWHLNAVLLGTYILIGLLGVYAMRGVGRAYEQMLEAQLRERTLALQAAHAEVLDKTRLATIGQTASVLAHEMRNPLASIKLGLSGIGISHEVPARSRHRLALVAGEVDRLDKLLSQTLDYARPIRLSAKPLAVQAIIAQVIEQQQPLLAERHLILHKRVAADCAPIRIDADKIYQAVLNVLKNAFEASPDGGAIEVTLSCDGTGEVVIEVANGGEPIAPDELARAFEPFYTTKTRGSGLGLGLVRRVVEEHGGSVSLVSDDETGTRISIRLPPSIG